MCSATDAAACFGLRVAGGIGLPIVSMLASPRRAIGASLKQDSSRSCGGVLIRNAD
jgi:hypothetical protein